MNPCNSAQRILRLCACACLLLLSAVPSVTSTAPGGGVEDPGEAPDDVRRIAAMAKDCAARMRRIAEITEARADRLLQKDGIRDTLWLEVLFKQVCLKQDLLRNEEVALQSSTRRLVLLWSDEYSGQVLSDEEVMKRFHEGDVEGSNTNAGATSVSP